MLVQAKVRQAVLVPQLEAVRQPTQAPWPLHIWLLVPHDAPADRLGFEGTPAVQRSCVQALPSTGRSALSVATMLWPLPSHCTFLQSPAVWAGTAVPAGALLMPQVPLMQVRVWQSVSVPGQLDAVKQVTQAPWPSQIRLVPQLLPAVTN